MSTTRLHELMLDMGQASVRLDSLGACEGSAGNVSVCTAEPLDLRKVFPLVEQVTLPLEAPSLEGMSILASGSGCRLRDIVEKPTENIGVLVVDAGGKTAKLHTAEDRKFTRLTSEFNTHLAVHRVRMHEGGERFHAVFHAQPLYLTMLSHIARYQDEDYLNKHVCRWEPETIVQFPEGIGVLAYQSPGSPEMARVTEESLRTKSLAIWSKHGAMARSYRSTSHAADLIEYAETAGHYEYMNLVIGEQADGISPEQIRDFCNRFGIKQSVY